MSTATVTMTPDEAREFRAAYGAQAARLSRMSRMALAIEERRLMRDQGIERIHGGPCSKDEFISSVLELRGYTITRLNEAIHILGHADVIWPDCNYCYEAHRCPECTGHGLMNALASCRACGGTGVRSGGAS